MKRNRLGQFVRTRRNPRGRGRPFYVTTYCNFAHDLYTGLPIRHECDQLSPVSLMLEREFGPRAVLDSIGSARSFRPGEFEIAEGIDEGYESEKDDLQRMYAEEVKRLGLRRARRNPHPLVYGTPRLGVLLHHWHGGQGDPIYGVGSMWYAGQGAHYSQVEGALRNLRRDRRDFRGPAGARRELDYLIRKLETVLE